MKFTEGKEFIKAKNSSRNLAEVHTKEGSFCAFIDFSKADDSVNFESLLIRVMLYGNSEEI